MFRKLAMISVLAATAALAGCATYGQQAYGNGRGDYYYGYPQASSSVGVSIGSGGYYYPYGGGYGYPAYGYGSYYGGGYYPGGYYNGYPYYGYPRYNNPRPRPDGNHGNRGPQKQPGWRDLDGIKDRNQPRPDTRAQTYQRPVRIEQRPTSAPRAQSRAEPRARGGAYSGVIQRAQTAKERKQIEP